MSNKLAKRVRELERRLQIQSVTVPLADGGFVHIRQRDALDVLLAAFQRAHFSMEGERAPMTQFDNTLDLLVRAAPDFKGDHLIATAIGVLTDDGTTHDSLTIDGGSDL